MRTKAASTCSLVLLGLLCQVAQAQDYRDLREKIGGQPPRVIYDRIRTDPKLASDPEFDRVLVEVKAQKGGPTKAQAGILEEIVDLRAELSPKSKSFRPEKADPNALAKSIKKKGLYADNGTAERSNWFERSLSRLKNFRIRPPDFNFPEPKGFSLFGLGALLTQLMWVLLGIGVIAFGYFLFRTVRFKDLKKAPRVKPEPPVKEMSGDELLAQADALASNGEFRLAIRAAYTACLKRIDEHRIAMFLPEETNWEHLRRIQASPRRPEGLNFRPPTQLFDRVWYGLRPTGQTDYDEIRHYYSDLMRQLEPKP